ARTSEYAPAAPELTGTPEGRRVSVQQKVYDLVTQSVFEWQVWNELLNKIQKDGTVRAASVARQQKRGGWEDEDDVPALRLPSDSREFFEPFKRTLERNESAASECVRQAVREQLAALARRTRPYLEQLAPLLADAQTRQRVEEFDRQEKAQGRRATGKG